MVELRNAFAGRPIPELERRCHEAHASHVVDEPFRAKNLQRARMCRGAARSSCSVAFSSNTRTAIPRRARSSAVNKPTAPPPAINTRRSAPAFIVVVEFVQRASTLGLERAMVDARRAACVGRILEAPAPPPVAQHHSTSLAGHVARRNVERLGTAGRVLPDPPAAPSSNCRAGPFGPASHAVVERRVHVI